MGRSTGSGGWTARRRSEGARPPTSLRLGLEEEVQLEPELVLVEPRLRPGPVVDAVLDARLDHPADERLRADRVAGLVVVVRHLYEVEGAAQVEPVEEEQVHLAIRGKLVAHRPGGDGAVVDDVELAEIRELPDVRAGVEA